jgi:hypothetical protein
MTLRGRRNKRKISVVAASRTRGLKLDRKLEEGYRES